MTFAAIAPVLVGVLATANTVLGDEALFREGVAPVLRRHCLDCHNDESSKGGLSLQSAERAFAGGESGEVIFPGDTDSSYLLDLIAPEDGSAEMPKGKEPLSEQERRTLRDWIEEGAEWPAELRLEPEAWWSFRPLELPVLPPLPDDRAAWCRTPIDRFIARGQMEHGLAPAKEADRRTLIRRLYFDLIGLPPSPEAIERFVNDPRRDAYDELVDELLASPHYGERWARHWLDVVHYGETHGYDKDKPRPNAWPYRDYVIRSFNEDKPYAQFVEEQIAGDVLYPESSDGIEALGFLAAGPWDFIGHAEVPETKIDGKIARHLDRDDMVQNVAGTFLSLTVGCAQCHDHKFDPITQQDYYGMQAVFAALDRADRAYFDDPAIERQHRLLVARRQSLSAEIGAIESLVEERGGEALADLEQQLQAVQEGPSRSPEYGYHSQIASSADNEKWVQVDLGGETAIDRVEYFPCHDDFNEIGAGFGFPVRYKIELADDAGFSENVRLLVDRTQEDFANPGITPQVASAAAQAAQFVRITATKLAPRQGDYIFALAELQVFDSHGNNVAAGQPVAALDSIEQPVRWRKSNLVDGLYPDAHHNRREQELQEQRDALLERAVGHETLARREVVRRELDDVMAAIESLPNARHVYAGTIHFGSGTFQGTGATGGKPRMISILHRGDVQRPGDAVSPGAVASLGVASRFDLSADATEGDARAALAGWLTHRENPLTWRSIVNRIWQYHFGRGLVDTPGDFGRMGELPSHPELLDWLAATFRDAGGSFKDIHRLIVTSAVYRQSSARADSAFATQGQVADDPTTNDSGNRLLWRMNRRQLEAEAVRDAILAVSGKLDPAMGGPSFQDFVIEKPEHSPHYRYSLHDPEDRRSHRRSIYRFVVRSQTQPFMTAMDCADPSMMVHKRNQTINPLQSLAMLNNGLTLVMSQHFADRVREQSSDLDEQIRFAFLAATGRRPTVEEANELRAHRAAHGLPSLCRVILNLNEFVFVD